MIDQEKLQERRTWGYVAGIALVLVLAAWKLIAR
jgi:hypothetical protein